MLEAHPPPLPWLVIVLARPSRRHGGSRGLPHLDVVAWVVISSHRDRSNEVLQLRSAVELQSHPRKNTLSDALHDSTRNRKEANATVIWF
jgi:hypothetical protein